MDTSASQKEYIDKIAQLSDLKSTGIRRWNFMTQTFDRVVDIIVKCCDIEKDAITAESHLVEDLGLDSVDMFDLVFALEQEFDIDLPVEDWGEEAEQPDAPKVQVADLIMRNFCQRIDGLVAAKDAN